MKLYIYLLSISLRAQSQPETVQIAPLATADLQSPYASPRDAARHRFQHAMKGLVEGGAAIDGLRGFMLAAGLDSTYEEAMFNVAVLAAVEEKYEDAILAYEKLEGAQPARAKTIQPELERLRLIAKRQETPEGRQRLAFDIALAKLLQDLPGLAAEEALARLAETAKLDASRWEAPALTAGIAGDMGQLPQAFQLLTIAMEMPADAAAKAKLKAALDYVKREIDYSTAVSAVEAASEREDLAVVASEAANAWNLFPARSTNAMEAATALLLLDKTADAAGLLRKAASMPDPDVARAAMGMLEKLSAIEPEAKAAIPIAPPEAGPVQLMKISPMLPDPRNAEMAILARESPRLRDDTAPVLLIDTLSQDTSVATSPAATTLPVLTPALPASGQRPMRELEILWRQRQAPATLGADGVVAQADRVKSAKTARNVTVKSTPGGAQIFYDEEEDAACVTPCTLRLSAGSHRLRLTLANHEEKEETLKVLAKDEEKIIALTPRRGMVRLESNAPAMIVVNDRPTLLSAPIEISLAPGLYKIGLDFGGIRADRHLTVKPDARLKLFLGYPKK